MRVYDLGGGKGLEGSIQRDGDARDTQVPLEGDLTFSYKLYDPTCLRPHCGSLSLSYALSGFPTARNRRHPDTVGKAWRKRRSSLNVDFSLCG